MLYELRNDRLLAELEFAEGAVLVALERMSRIVPLARTYLKGDELIGILNLAGLIYKATGDSIKAERLFNETAELARGFGFLLLEAGALTNLGSLMNERGDVALADQTLKSAVTLARRAKDGKVLGPALVNLGNNSWSVGAALPQCRFVASEADMVNSVLSEAGFRECRFLRDSEATIEEVSLLHFACHGFFDVNDISGSGLALWDGVLRCDTISAVELERTPWLS